MEDVSYGPQEHLRGHWRDRLPAIDADVARMERALEGAPNRGAGAAAGAVDEAMGRPQRPWVPCGHEPPPAFQPGQAVELRLVVEGREPGQDPSGVQLRYRHVNQAEVWEAVEMERAGRAWQAAIPAAYTDSPYPLQYHFVLRRGGGRAWQFPGLGPELVQQPYFVVRQA
jgi:hypothetical protein